MPLSVANHSYTNPSLTARRLPRYFVACAAIFSVGLTFVITVLLTPEVSDFSLVTVSFWSAVAFVGVMTVSSLVVEGRRAAIDRAVTIFVSGAFLIVLVPLLSLLFTVISEGLQRFDTEFFSSSMRNIVGEGGGALHAMMGTLVITASASAISIPIGVMTAFYVTEYRETKLSKLITSLVDIMTGIPSIVAGLFAYTVFSLILGAGTRMGFIGAISLTILMTPIIIRTSEEMFRLVPQDIREASLALGVTRWRTAVSVVLPTALPGVLSGIMLAIARVIGETAPLLITAGFTSNMNLNLFQERMQSLPVYIYTQFAHQGNPAHAFMERAWAAALMLVLIVVALYGAARIISHITQRHRT